jgi:1-acyl-sn-glycerol-3-phosphate acyltransferase
VEAKKNHYPAQIYIEAIRVFGWTISKLFWRIKFYGTENIPHDLEGGLLVCPNHQTYFDPVWVCIKIKRKYRFMAWDKAFDWFIVGRVIRYLGSFPVSYERGGTLKALKESLRSLRQGATLIIFPEGERQFTDGKMLEFKPGALRIAMEAGVPILPVTIRGGNKVWGQDMNSPRPGKVEIFYHPVFPVPRPPEGVEVHAHIDRLTNDLREIIASKL